MPRNPNILRSPRIAGWALFAAAGALALSSVHEKKDIIQPASPADVSELEPLPTHSGLLEEFTTDIESRDGTVTWYTNFKNRTAIYTEQCAGLMHVEQFSNGHMQSNYDYDECSDHEVDLDETYPRQSAFEDSLFTVPDPKAENY